MILFLVATIVWLIASLPVAVVTGRCIRLGQQ